VGNSRFFLVLKIFTSYSTDIGLISRIHRELKKTKQQRTNIPINKWTKELSKQFSEEIQMASK
jgi:uridine kinase